MTACHTKTDDERYCFLPASFEIFQISNAGVGETLSSNMFVAEATMQKRYKMISLWPRFRSMWLRILVEKSWNTILKVQKDGL